MKTASITTATMSTAAAGQMLVVVVSGGLGLVTHSSQPRWSIGPWPWPRRHGDAPSSAASTKDFASRVASGTSRPSARPAAMAADSEQPGAVVVARGDARRRRRRRRRRSTEQVGRVFALRRSRLGEVAALDEDEASDRSARIVVARSRPRRRGSSTSSTSTPQSSAASRRLGVTTSAQGNEGVAVGVDAAVVHQRVAGGRDEDRVDDEVGEATLASERGDRLHRRGLAEHAGLDRAHVEVVERRRRPGRRRCRGRRTCTALTPRVFWAVTAVRARGAVHPEGAEGAQVGLDPGAAARVRARDGQDGDGLHSFNPNEPTNRISTLGAWETLSSSASLTSPSRLVDGDRRVPLAGRARRVARGVASRPSRRSRCAGWTRASRARSTTC